VTSNAGGPSIEADREEIVSPIRRPAGVEAGGENTRDVAAAA
jgi:hypothetical protein